MHNGQVNQYGDLLRSALNQGLPLDRAMELLRASGASPLEAASAVQDAGARTADEARRLVNECRAWTGPRSAVQLSTRASEWSGAIGQHGRSGQGAASVLPHLWRPAPRPTSQASP
jgi:hypothetical protein